MGALKMERVPYRLPYMIEKGLELFHQKLHHGFHMQSLPLRQLESVPEGEPVIPILSPHWRTMVGVLHPMQGQVFSANTLGYRVSALVCQ